ncbi:MAG: hypothetical protein HC924_09790 [Synechococcaceae cyanobacterium SM2_3_2]|nr:hypothetical protein [Synechococcaceae cyanobacterium SM2_3_2]
MPEDLTHAIRARDLSQASRAIAIMQQHMSQERVRKVVIACVEQLAWAEGDRCAAIWLLKHPHLRFMP